MVGGPDAFLKNTIVSFGFRNMSLGRAEMEVDTLEVILDFIKDSLELVIAVEVADLKTIAIVQP